MKRTVKRSGIGLATVVLLCAGAHTCSAAFAAVLIDPATSDGSWESGQTWSATGLTATRTNAVTPGASDGDWYLETTVVGTGLTISG